jgi:heat shock protein HtpX
MICIAWWGEPPPLAAVRPAFYVRGDMVPFASPLNESERRRHRLRNAAHTWLLILGSGGLVALIAWILFGTAGIVWAALLTGIGLWSAGQVSPKLVLGLYRARPLSPYDLPELHHIVRQLAARADLPAMPQLFYVPSRVMNAFAVGRPEESAIAITDGLLRGLTLRQLAGVLAHEVSHIRNGDLKVMALGDVLTRLTSLMSTIGLVALAVSLPAMLAAGMQVPWLAIVLLIFAPTIGGLMQLALSRAREYDADLDAAGLTGDPHGLASALLTLERRQGRLWEGLFLPGSRLPDPSLLRSHPRTEDRIERLMSLTPAPSPVIITPETWNEAGAIAYPVRKPRIHWRRMGTWY